MSHEVMANFAIAGILAIPTIGILAALLIGARRRAERAESIVHQLAQRALGTHGELNVPARTDLQHSIDALALEVERLAEGQRFVSRVLTERSSLPRAANDASRSITPH